MQMSESPAHKALSRGGARILDEIAGEIERDSSGAAVLSFNDLAARCNLTRIAVRVAVKRLVALGFIKIGFGPRRISVFRLTNGWRAIDTDMAARLVREARAVKLLRPERLTAPRPKAVQPAKVQPAPVEPRARRQPSLPRLACLQGDP
jgi:DNA-binding MarR family transcriptional regulator